MCAYLIYEDGQRNLKNYPPGEEPRCKHVSGDPNDPLLDVCGEPQEPNELNP